MSANRTSGRAGRRKGDERERQIVKRYLDDGIFAARVPLSGAAGGPFTGDVDAYPFGRDVAPLVGEVKFRATGKGFSEITDWLGDNDWLALVRNRAEPMVVVSWATWMRVLKAIRQ